MIEKFVNEPTLKEQVVYILLEEYGVAQDIVDKLMEKYYDQVIVAFPSRDADHIVEALIEKLTYKKR